jgi:hypothetical protein
MSGKFQIFLLAFIAATDTQDPYINPIKINNPSQPRILIHGSHLVPETPFPSKSNQHHPPNPFPNAGIGIQNT